MAQFYLLAAALGMLIGASEIISRYRDAPGGALRTASAWLYIGLNGVASLSAFALVQRIPALNDAIGGPDEATKELLQALAAGLSAMALFRSSFFTIRVANTDVSIGPAAFLQILLSAADRATDRARAGPRARAVQEIMNGISFARAKEALPTLCFGLMQGVTPEEQQTFGNGVKALDASAMEDNIKANSLGLNLMNLVGVRVLREAVDTLRNDISAKPRPIVQSILTLQLLRQVDFEKSYSTLVDGCLFIANKVGDTNVRADLEADVARIAALRVSDQRKVLFLSAILIGRFGEETVQLILNSLTENTSAAAKNAAEEAAKSAADQAEPAKPGADEASAAADPTGAQTAEVVPFPPQPDASEQAQPEPPDPAARAD